MSSPSNSRSDGAGEKAEELLLEACSIGRRKPEDANTWLLKELSWQIRPGERWSVSGDSGSGKTLLLRALALLDPLDSGTIRWKGHKVDAQDVPAYRSKVIYLHQRPVIFEGSIESNFKRPFAFKANCGRHFDAPRIHELLSTLARDPSFLKKPNSGLSGGEAQIVALVRALQLDPFILLLDEPTASLDDQTTGAVEELVLGWIKQSPQARALIWISHDEQQARKIGSHHLRLARGRIEHAT